MTLLSKAVRLREIIEQRKLHVVIEMDGGQPPRASSGGKQR